MKSKRPPPVVPQRNFTHTPTYPQRRSMKVKVRGRYWNLLFTEEGLAPGQQGECQAPHIKGKTIKVRPGMSPLEELDTTLHELLHAGLWDLDEEAVEELGSDLARVLRKLGYRRVDI